MCDDATHIQFQHTMLRSPFVFVFFVFLLTVGNLVTKMFDWLWR